MFTRGATTKGVPRYRGSRTEVEKLWLGLVSGLGWHLRKGWKWTVQRAGSFDRALYAMVGWLPAFGIYSRGDLINTFGGQLPT